jgi:hypothetical protein
MIKILAVPPGPARTADARSAADLRVAAGARPSVVALAVDAGSRESHP